jgi:hypothetical protein
MYDKVDSDDDDDDDDDNNFKKIKDFNGPIFEDSDLLGCDAVSLG